MTYIFKGTPKSNIARRNLEPIVGIFLAVLVSQIGWVYFVKSSSQVQSGKRVITDKISYVVRAPRINDEIVYEQSDRSSSTFQKSYALGHVVGIPGDQISVQSGQNLINKEFRINHAISKSLQAPNGSRILSRHYLVSTLGNEPSLLLVKLENVKGKRLFAW